MNPYRRIFRLLVEFYGGLASTAYYRHLYYTTPGLGRSSDGKEIGFSVRFVRD